MLEQIEPGIFEALVGQTIRLSAHDGGIDLEIAAVNRLLNPSPRPVQPFSLVLRDRAATQAFAQGVYRLHHPTQGDIDLFVVPTGPDGIGMCYEITFN